MIIWSHATSVFQNIPTIKVFANISPNVLLNNKLSSWMIALEICNIEHHIVQNYKLFSLFDTILELFISNESFRLFEFIFPSLHYLENNLIQGEESEENAKVGYTLT
jgi:hypothetical protein